MLYGFIIYTSEPLIDVKGWKRPFAAVCTRVHYAQEAGR
jgi:hypothetical protein